MCTQFQAELGPDQWDEVLGTQTTEGPLSMSSLISFFKLFFPSLLLNSRFGPKTVRIILALLTFLAVEGVGAEKRTEVAFRKWKNTLLGPLWTLLLIKGESQPANDNSGCSGGQRSWGVTLAGRGISVGPTFPAASGGVSGQCVTQSLVPLWGAGVSDLTGDGWVISAVVFVAGTSHLAGRQCSTSVPFLLDLPYHQHMEMALLS